MQPKMNKRKSVSRVTEKDAKDATKYVLTHQRVDAEGDLETNLVKVLELCPLRIVLQGGSDNL